MASSTWWPDSGRIVTKQPTFGGRLRVTCQAQSKFRVNTRSVRHLAEMWDNEALLLGALGSTAAARGELKGDKVEMDAGG